MESLYVDFNIVNGTRVVSVHAMRTETLRDAAKANGVDLSGKTLDIDGTPVDAGVLNQTLDELGIEDGQYVTGTQKASNAR